MRRSYLPAATCILLALAFVLLSGTLRGRSSVAAEGAEPRLGDINSADAAELQLLPGIGEVKAAAIIEYRLGSGPFSDVEELLEVPGIGPAVLDGLRDYVCAGGLEDAA